MEVHFTDSFYKSLKVLIRHETWWYKTYGNNLNNQNLGGYTPSQIAQGASPGGAFTPTAGNSFTLA